MALETLTDKAFYEGYQKNPEIKAIVDKIQMKYKTHKSQEGQPGYNPNNLQWYQEAKGVVGNLLAQQKQAQEKTIQASAVTFSEKIPYAAGLLGTLTAIVAFGTGAYAFGLIGALIAVGSLLYSSAQKQYSYKPA